MSIELTDAQALELAAEGEGTVVIDPRTERRYRLVPANPTHSDPSGATALPPAVQASRAALRRDLPDLLKTEKNRGQCVCYQGNRQIGIARFRHALQEQCIRLGILPNEYYIGVIEEGELIDEEEIDGFRPDLVENSPKNPCHSS
jgi:hypothetical protein